MCIYGGMGVGLCIFMVNSLLPLFLCDFCPALCSARSSHLCVIPAGSPAAAASLSHPAALLEGEAEERRLLQQGRVSWGAGWASRAGSWGAPASGNEEAVCAQDWCCAHCMGFCGSISSFICLQGSLVILHWELPRCWYK